MRYEIGQSIGKLTIIAYIEEKKNYILKCSCGNFSEGTSSHVSKKIGNLLGEGFAACRSCSSKKRDGATRARLFDKEYIQYKDVYAQYIKSARERNYLFNLSLEEAIVLFKSNCYYCGTSPKNSKHLYLGEFKDTKVYYQGIDRVDNSIGYELNNVVPCCKLCNSCKNTQTLEEFDEHIDKMYLMKVQRLSPKGE